LSLFLCNSFLNKWFDLKNETTDFKHTTNTFIVVDVFVLNVVTVIVVVAVVVVFFRKCFVNQSVVAAKKSFR
jgi:hypothetical protein